MTAVVVAMLVIVMVATAVLAAVGGYHHLAASPAVQRRLRRWRFLALTRLDDWQATAFHVLRVSRRGLAQRLGRGWRLGRRWRFSRPALLGRFSSAN